MRVRASTRHQTPERPPISVAPGDPVMVGDRDTDWPAFVFVTAPSGRGWVPARHLSADAGAAVVEHPYDTTELAVAQGQEVTVVERDDASGWWWCRTDDGAEGWVPISVFRPA